MNFNERLIELRKSRGLSQIELGEELGVSRQTISKWELAQSYPDFQRLVLISDYFGLSLDALMKGVDVQDVRDRNQQDRHLEAIYQDVQRAKSTLQFVLNLFAAIGIVGMAILVGIIVLFG